MNRIRLLPTATGLLLLLFAGGAFAAIPSFNGTCPGGVALHADEGGPVYINGRQTQLKRFNDDYYEARDGDSGVTVSIMRSPDGGVQLSYTDRSGANGVCEVGSAASVGNAHANSREGEPAQEVTCESRDRRQAECDMDTRGEVQLVRQLSSTRCVQGQNWGLNRHSIWVKDGCRGVFRNVSRASGHSSATAAAGDTLLGA